MFAPNLDVLAQPQQMLWRELGSTPKEFVLYGGTALALRLGHRRSDDFDFFSNRAFVPASLRETIPYLRHAEMSQFEKNTLTAIVDRGGPVKISFFGGLKLNRVEDPEHVRENGIQVASLVDIAATKLAVIQQRAQAKDYQDMVSIIGAGIPLAQVLAAATAIYGKEFNGALSLKALAYFEDGDLPSLSLATQNKLRAMATDINLRELSQVVARNGLTANQEIPR